MRDRLNHVVPSPRVLAHPQHLPILEKIRWFTFTHEKRNERLVLPYVRGLIEHGKPFPLLHRRTFMRFDQHDEGVRSGDTLGDLRREVFSCREVADWQKGVKSLGLK